VTGNELGTLKPCGCSGGQLGGFSRRATILNSVAKDQRLIVDTGSLVDGNGPQSLIKFNVIVRAFGLLGYDLVNLSREDLETAQNLGLLGNIGHDYKIMTPPGAVDVNLPASFSKRMSLKGRPIVLTFVSFDAQSGKAGQIEGLFGTAPDTPTVRILVLDGCEPENVGSFVKRLKFVDCVICVDCSDRPEVIGDPAVKPLVVSAGQLGKYVGKLQITPGKGKGGVRLAFSAVAVTEDLREDETLVDLYGGYQQLVRDSGILELEPRIGLGDGLEYRGSASCKGCHKYSHDKWKEKKHADAFAILEEVGSDHDPECVVCHVVGMRYESGFVSPDTTPDMKNVGCENCHGPGSEHIDSLGEQPTGEPRTDCGSCHTPDHSAHYNGNEAEYFQKIVHWREQEAAGNVKLNKKQEVLKPDD